MSVPSNGDDSQSVFRHGVFFHVACAAAVATTAVLLWCTNVPLGIPGEWTWLRLDADPQSFANALVAVMAAAAYLGFVVLGRSRLQRLRITRVESAAWRFALFVAGFAWLWTVQETAPSAGQLAKAPFVLYYEGTSGYFFHARYKSPQAAVLLREYEPLMAQGDVLHVGTHPPGLFLVFHGLIELVNRYPAIIPRLTATEPETVREAFGIIAENTVLTPHPLTPADRAVIWLAALLTLTAAAATVWPLYGLLRPALDRPSAWTVAAAWPAVPAVAVFLPKSDAVFPFLACGLLWLAMQSVRKRSAWWGLATGLAIFLGLFCSLAFLPVLLFGGTAVILGSINRGGWRTAIRNLAWPTLGVLLGVLAPVIALRGTFALNLFAVWAWNYRNHAGFYVENRRTYSTWLLANPVELALAVGLPIAFAALAGLSGLRSRARFRTLMGMALSVGFAVWTLLWLSGKNSGEAARLWLLLMPGVVWAAGQGLRRRRARSETPRPGGNAGRSSVTTTSLHDECIDPPIAVAWLAWQLAASILTVHRVGGFHLNG